MDSSITYNFEDVKIPDFDPEFFDLWIKGIVKEQGKELGELGYIFCSDEYLLTINREYLSHDYYTDIITFNYNEGNSLSGDLFISYDRIIDNAKCHGTVVWDELCRVVIHGVLHLIGFNDKTDEEQLLMTEEENKSLAKRNCFT